LIIVEVSASSATEAFVGTVCLIAVRRSVSGEQVVVDVGEFIHFIHSFYSLKFCSSF